MVQPKITACGGTVRRHDRDRFLLSLTAEPPKRSALWALFAFNYEIAKTREVVTEPKLGEIRLQWWREAVEGIYAGKVLEHEVVAALAGAVREHDLPQDMFQALIDARDYDLSGKTPASYAELEMYADRTTTPLNKLALKIAGQKEDDKAVRAVSIGYALTGLLRAAPHHAAQGRRYLPKGEQDAAAVAALAEKYFGSAQPSGPYLKLSAALGRAYLKKMKRLDYDLSDRRLGHPPLPLMMKCWLTGMRK